MNPPLISTITLVTELFVTASVLSIFYSGYRKNAFPFRLALATVLYEILFNITYMAYRAATHHDTAPHSRFHIALAIFHGTFSLVMFVALIVFLLAAWKKYKKGVNFFRDHRVLTATFIALWLLAVISGIAFYFVAYSNL